MLLEAQTSAYGSHVFVDGSDHDRGGVMFDVRIHKLEELVEVICHYKNPTMMK